MNRYTLSAVCVVLGLGEIQGATRAAALDKAASDQLGLRTVVVHAATQSPAVDAAIDVLDPAPLARAAGELVIARAAALASAAEARRSEQLYRAGATVAAKVAEVARAQAITDAARVDQSHAELRLAWGPRLAGMDTASLARNVNAYVTGIEVLLRAQPLGAGNQRPDSAEIVTVTGSVPAHVVDRLPQSAAGVSIEWLLEADGQHLVPGMHVTGKLRQDGHPIKGIAVPREAIVRWNGLSWIYVQADATHFTRTAIHPLARDDDAWLVDPADVVAGAHVVVAGAAALLAIDAGASAAD